tara:strand:+ start:2809 stop:3540 length:732 start_codon:yes stop_codon:yes gene_type:complete
MKIIIRNLIFLINNLFLITSSLKKCNFSKKRLFKFISWHHGYCYFTGFIGENKVFIKIDTKFLLLKNEYISYKYLKNTELNLVKVYEFFDFGDIQIIAFDFFEAKNLSEGDIVKKPKQIISEIKKSIDVLIQNNICHRDIKLDNFLFKNDKVFMIDFSFAINIKQGKENVLKELSPTHENVLVLKYLGINIKNENFIIWNDYYSVQQILVKLNEVYALDNPIINKYIDQFDALSLNNNYSYRL